MKYLLRVLFVLAMFCGFTSHARAVGVDFHVQVLDPAKAEAFGGRMVGLLNEGFLGLLISVLREDNL